MKINTKLNALKRIVGVAAVAAPTKTTLPCLNCLHISFKEGSLVARASNMRTFVVARCEAHGEQETAFGVPAVLLDHFLSNCTAEDVEIEVSQQAEFRCGSSVTRLSIADMTDFPTTPAVEPMKSFDWDSAALRTAIGKVLHAAAEPNDTDPRPLASICFDFSDALDIVATDAKQVAAYTLPIPGDGRFLVPRESASTLLKLLDATDGKIAVVLGEKSASFSGSDWTYLSVLMAGGFPPWKSVVTEGMPAISMVRSDLIRAVRSALPFGMEAGFTRVELVGKDKTLTVHSGLANAMDTTITAEFDGEIKMAVEGRRLMSLVSALEGENVVIKFDDVPGHGIIMREENFMGIIMPLRK